MSLAELYEKIAAVDEEVGEVEKIASYYDQMGRELFWSMLGIDKEAAPKLKPGMFSGRKGILKALGIGAVGAGGYAVGKKKGEAKSEAEEVELARRAYGVGVQRGAQAMLQRMRGGG